MEVVIFPHTHWDREWYRPFQDFRIRLIEVMDLLLDELCCGQTDYFYLDGQTVILDDYLEIYPEKTGLIKKFIADKRLFIGPWYVLADEFLVCGESLIRNLLTGINQAKQYGCGSFFGYLPDSFGHNSQIPLILSSFGMERAVLWRGAGDRKSEFIWESGDGSSVLATYLVEGYFQDILHAKLPDAEKTGKLKELLDLIKSRTVSDKILLPAGGDHLGPVIGLKNIIERLNKKISGYELKQGRIEEYFKSLKPDHTGIKTVKGELRDNSRNPILPGTLSTRLCLKQMNACSSWLLSRLAEPLQSFLEATGAVKSKKNELDYAWKLLLKNHPHDSICGCSVDEVHEENISGFKQVNQISNAVINRCINKISGMIPENQFIVCNLSNYNYSGLVKIKTSGTLPEEFPCQQGKTSIEFPDEVLLDTQKAPFCEDMREFREYLVYAENIPAFSFNPLLPANCPDSVEVFNYCIRNSSVEVVINPCGSINLKDLKTGKAFKNLHIITDRADIGDTYNYAPFSDDKLLKAELISTGIKNKGPLQGVLELTYRLNIPKYFDYNSNSRSSETEKTIITTEIILSACSKRVEFRTFWKNCSENHIMQLKFNLPEKIAQTVSEDAFGLITRDFDPGYTPEEHIPAQKGQELRTNSAPMQRFVFARGLGIITEGLSEYVISQNSLNITILRSVGKLSEISLNTRKFPAGPALNTPGAQCRGDQSVRYALCVSDSPKELFKEADEFMGSVISFTGQALEETSGFFTKILGHCKGSAEEFFPLSLIKISNDNLLVYAVKSPENRNLNGVVIRLFNVSDIPVKAFFSSELNFSGFMELNSLEEPISEKYGMGKEVIFGPQQLKSFCFFL